MKKGFTLIEFIVVIAILGILAGMLLPAISMVRSAAAKQNAMKTGTQESKDSWKFSNNLTPSAQVESYILTDPTTNQSFLLVKSSHGISITPYDKTKIQVESH